MGVLTQSRHQNPENVRVSRDFIQFTNCYRKSTENKLFLLKEREHRKTLSYENLFMYL